MADIYVQRKGPSIWPWIIGLLVLALLIWALVQLFEEDEAAIVEEPATVVLPADLSGIALTSQGDSTGATAPAESMG